MSRVTFIVGNGLDLSLGLKTTYKDFYNFVNQTKSTSVNKIYKEIKNSPDTWADFESSLGTYSKHINDLVEPHVEAASIALHDDLEEIRDDLADYLSSQENFIQELPEKYYLNGNGFFEDLPSGQADIIKSTIGNSHTTAHFITLNYTTTLEKILESGTVQKELGWSVTRPLHIHGDLAENMTIGVSDETQLGMGMPIDERNDLIKPELVRSINDGRLEKMIDTINGSSIVVIYGSSLGITDAYIWRLLCTWLLRSENRRVIVHKHDRTYIDTTKRSPRKQRLYIKGVQDQLLGYSKFDENVKDALRGRIFVVHNTKKLFVRRKQN